MRCRMYGQLQSAGQWAGLARGGRMDRRQRYEGQAGRGDGVHQGRLVVVKSKSHACVGTKHAEEGRGTLGASGVVPGRRRAGGVNHDGARLAG